MSPAPSQCKYEEGKPGKRGRDAANLRRKMSDMARRKKSEFFKCLKGDARSEFVKGDDKTRKGVSLTP